MSDISVVIDNREIEVVVTDGVINQVISGNYREYRANITATTSSGGATNTNSADPMYFPISWTLQGPRTISGTFERQQGDTYLNAADVTVWHHKTSGTAGAAERFGVTIDELGPTHLRITIASSDGTDLTLAPIMVRWFEAE